MSNKIINTCPSCGASMVISQLKCEKCGIAINGEFEIGDGSFFHELSQEEANFIKIFIKNEGNLSKTQRDCGIGANGVKNMLKNINMKLGNNVIDSYPDLITDLPRGDREDKITASGEIINAFNEAGGVVDCPMMRGQSIKIWMTKDGVRNSALPSLLCTWKQFDEILEKAISLGGIMYRGDTAAQNGCRIGSKDLPFDTMEAFIATKYFGRKEGETTVRRSTYYAAIMKWAGICDNCRSNGNGGYISVAKWLMQ